MRNSKSHTVRLKEEVLGALEGFVFRKGRTQQQVVSVGAWFYMCVPPILREALDEAFYEWCKANVDEAYIRGGSGKFIEGMMSVIEAECRKIDPGFAVEKEPSPELAEAIHNANAKTRAASKTDARLAKKALDAAISEENRLGKTGSKARKND